MADPTTALDLEHEFARAFTEKVNEQYERSGAIPTSDWRAGGRRSKAWPDKENRQWWEQNGPLQVKAYAEWREQIHGLGWQLWTAPGGIPAIELELMAVFGTVPIRMFIDRVFVSPLGELVVVDLKSGSRVPDNHLQLGIYACGMELVLGTRPSYGAYYMTRDVKLTDPVPLDGYTVGQITAELEMFNKAVDQEIFIPHRSSHCISCGVAKACAAVGGPLAPLYDPLHPDYGKATT